MIKYNLACKCGKSFESWFSSSAEYDALKKKKLVNCIYCNSASVIKSVMSPNLSSKSNKNFFIWRSFNQFSSIRNASFFG